MDINDKIDSIVKNKQLKDPKPEEVPSLLDLIGSQNKMIRTMVSVIQALDTKIDVVKSEVDMLKDKLRVVDKDSKLLM